MKTESNILKIFEDLRAQLRALLNHADKAWKNANKTMWTKYNSQNYKTQAEAGWSWASW